MPYQYFSDGQKQTGNLVGTVAGYAIPWYGLMRAISSGMSGPFERNDKDTENSLNLQNQNVAQNNPNMQMSSAPQSESNAFGAAGEIGNMFMPGSVRALNGADMPSQPSVAGGFSLQPQHVDSSQSPYQNSGISAFETDSSPLAKFSRDYYQKYGR